MGQCVYIAKRLEGQYLEDGYETIGVFTSEEKAREVLLNDKKAEVCLYGFEDTDKEWLVEEYVLDVGEGSYYTMFKKSHPDLTLDDWLKCMLEDEEAKHYKLLDQGVSDLKMKYDKAIDHLYERTRTLGL